MRALPNFAMLLLRCVPAFFRSRGEQAIVELALRQQLVTYAQKRSKPRLTPFCAKSQPSRNASSFGILEAGMVAVLGLRPTP